MTDQGAAAGIPAKGQRVQSTADACTGTIQWVDPVHACMRVAWDDGTASTEATGEDRRWVLLGEDGHVCEAPLCRCPADGEWLLYAPAWGEHACPRVGCGYAHGPGPGGGWVGTVPGHQVDDLR